MLLHARQPLAISYAYSMHTASSRARIPWNTMANSIYNKALRIGRKPEPCMYLDAVSCLFGVVAANDMLIDSSARIRGCGLDQMRKKRGTRHRKLNHRWETISEHVSNFRCLVPLFFRIWSSPQPL